MTPLEFARRRTAYRRKQETLILPFRRLEAAIWNVQIAKTRDGKQIKASDLYELEIDQLTQAKPVKKTKPKAELSAQEMQALYDFFNS